MYLLKLGLDDNMVVVEESHIKEVITAVTIEGISWVAIRSVNGLVDTCFLPSQSHRNGIERKTY
jgi:hypothetical protein